MINVLPVNGWWLWWPRGWLWFSSHNDISRRWRNRLAHGELSCSPRRLILVPGSRSAASNHNPLRHHFHNPTRRHYLLTSASFPSSLTLSLQPATVCSPTAAGNSAKSSLKGQQLLEVVARLHCCGAPNPWQHRMFILNRNVRIHPSITEVRSGIQQAIFVNIELHQVTLRILYCIIESRPSRQWMIQRGKEIVLYSSHHVPNGAYIGYIGLHWNRLCRNNDWFVYNQVQAFPVQLQPRRLHSFSASWIFSEAAAARLSTLAMPATDSRPSRQ